MQKLKMKMSMLFALVAVALAIGTSAFTNKATKKGANPFFYYVMYQGVESSSTDRTTPGNYELANDDGSDITCEEGENHLCKIYAEDNGSGQPQIPGASGLFNSLNNSGASLPDAANGVSLKQ